MRVLLFAALMFLAWRVLRHLWPRARRAPTVVVLAALSALALSAWGVPALMGRSIHGPMPVLGEPGKLFGAMWLVAAVLVLFGGGAFLVLSSLIGRVASGRGASKADAAEGALAGGQEVDMARRGFMTTLGKAVPLAALATSGAGVAEGSLKFTTKRMDVPVKDLPAALEGFKIGQITDIHVGAFVSAADVRRAVETMNAEGCHLQVMTGDLIDDLEQMDGTFDALAANTAPHGMLAILGNHEHWRGLEHILPKYAQAKAKGVKLELLVDEARVVEHAGARLHVVGVDYPMGLPGLGGPSRDELMQRSADKSFPTVAPGEPVLCLSHHPDFFDLAAGKGAHLTLSGHTHGGQIAFLGIPAFAFAFRYMLGKFRIGDKRLYVSGGTGHWLPFRLGVPTEVSIHTLRRA